MTAPGKPTAVSAPSSLEPADPRAELLLELVDGLRAPYGCERSFRLSRGALLPHRFLVSVAVDSVPDDPRRRVVEICRRLQMPGVLLAEAERHLDGAGFVHFGYEEGRTGALYKVYLEQGGAEAEVARAVSDDPAPVLLHLGLKWDCASGGNGTVTSYHWYPSLSVAGIASRLCRLYEEAGREEARRLALRVLEVAAPRAGRDGLRYLEVTEAGNRRRSFDLNCYDAGMTLEALSPVLGDMCRHFGVDPGRLRTLYDGIKGCALGHVAGGVHREAEEFFTLYYGVEGRRGGGR